MRHVVVESWANAAAMDGIVEADANLVVAGTRSSQSSLASSVGIASPRDLVVSIVEALTTNPAVVAEMEAVKVDLTAGRNVCVVMAVPTITEDADLRSKVARAFAGMGWEPHLVGAGRDGTSARAP
jgi:hypothetical protein